MLVSFFPARAPSKPAIRENGHGPLIDSPAEATDEHSQHSAGKKVEPESDGSSQEDPWKTRRHQR